MTDKKIKVIVLDGLDADDILKLKHGGFFDGVSVLLPQGVTGQAATLTVKEQPVALLESKPHVKELANTSETLAQKVVLPSGYDANVRDALDQAEAKQVEAVVAKKTRRKAEEKVAALVEDRAVELAANKADEEPVPAADTAEPELSIDMLLNFTKLRDLIQYVVSTGIHPTGVAAFCESMKAEVPLLQRITNIEERVTRTLEVMGFAEGK